MTPLPDRRDYSGPRTSRRSSPDKVPVSPSAWNQLAVPHDEADLHRATSLCAGVALDRAGLRHVPRWESAPNAVLGIGSL
jgi:hypothetical protein